MTIMVPPALSMHSVGPLDRIVIHQRADLMGRRRGATADGAIVMVVWEVDARAIAVGGGGGFGKWGRFGR